MLLYLMTNMNILQRALLLLMLGFASTLLARQASDKSDRENAGLIGPIATVKLESTYFKRENGKWVESERHVYEQSEYDKSGKLINQKKTPMYGDPASCQHQYKYDDRHRTTEIFCTDGDREKIIWKYAYEDDRFGNWIKRTGSVPDGETFRVQSILYRTLTYFD
jgi:YD repeat-containing protein